MKLTRCATASGDAGPTLPGGGSTAPSASAIGCSTPPRSRSGKCNPWRDSGANLCLVLDGRVDNRKELHASLGVGDGSPGGDTDAGLILRAYRRWGVGLLDRVVGDFAFALWDGDRGELLCARDFLGIRPFYYAVDADRFLFASELTPP